MLIIVFMFVLDFYRCMGTFINSTELVRAQIPFVYSLTSGQNSDLYWSNRKFVRYLQKYKSLAKHFSQKLIDLVLTIFNLQKGDLFKDLVVFTKDDGYLENILTQTDIIDWNTFICLGMYVSFVVVIML